MKSTSVDLAARLLDFTKLKFELRKTMRYDDVGDYFDNTIVSFDTGNQVLNNAIMLHEFIEYTLIKASGIDPELIDQFDTDPKTRKQFPREYSLYGKFHDLSNLIERQFIENLELNWEEHQEKIYAAPVQIAAEEITQDMHMKKPSPKKIEETAKKLENI